MGFGQERDPGTVHHSSFIVRIGIAVRGVDCHSDASARAASRSAIGCCAEPAGGATDNLARVIRRALRSARADLVVDNRPAANCNLSTEAAARATPDGHAAARPGHQSSSARTCTGSAVQHLEGPDTGREPVSTRAASSASFAPVKSVPDLWTCSPRQPAAFLLSIGNGSRTTSPWKAESRAASTCCTYLQRWRPAMVALFSGEVPMRFGGSSAAPHVRSGAARARPRGRRTRVSSCRTVRVYPGSSESCSGCSPPQPAASGIEPLRPRPSPADRHRHGARIAALPSTRSSPRRKSFQSNPRPTTRSSARLSGLSASKLTSRLSQVAVCSGHLQLLPTDGCQLPTSGPAPISGRRDVRVLRTARGIRRALRPPPPVETPRRARAFPDRRSSPRNGSASQSRRLTIFLSPR